MVEGVMRREGVGDGGGDDLSVLFFRLDFFLISFCVFQCFYVDFTFRICERTMMFTFHISRE